MRLLLVLLIALPLVACSRVVVTRPAGCSCPCEACPCPDAIQPKTCGDGTKDRCAK